MTFVTVNFDDVVEPKPATPGKYPLQIVKCDVVKTGDKSKRPGSPQYRVSIGFPEQPDTPNLTQYISLPHEEDEPGSANFKALLLKRFLHLFSIPLPTGGFETESLAMQMVGATATAEVGLTEPNENGDVYNTLVVPKIAGEPDGRGTPPTRRGR